MNDHTDLTVVTTIRHPDALVLAVTGEIDTATAPVLEQNMAALLDDKVRHLVLDFSGVGFFDSSVLSVLIGFWQVLREDTAAWH